MQKNPGETNAVMAATNGNTPNGGLTLTRNKLKGALALVLQETDVEVQNRVDKLKENAVSFISSVPDVVRGQTTLKK